MPQKLICFFLLHLLQMILSHTHLQGFLRLDKLLVPNSSGKELLLFILSESCSSKFLAFQSVCSFLSSHLVMTSAFGRMPLTLQPFFPAVSHHNFLSTGF